MDGAAIGSVTQAAAGPAAAAATTGSATLGHEDFLTLLVAQLQSQDPLNPMDGTEFSAQLAQFSSLEQLMEINEGISKIGAGAVDGAATFASLLGREVALAEPTLAFGNGTTTAAVELRLASSAPVELELFDGSGATVARLDAGTLPAGDHRLDPASLGGAGSVPAGVYGVRAFAGSGTQRSPASVRVFETVTGIDLTEGATRLVVSGRRVDMADVVEIRVADGAGTTA